MKNKAFIHYEISKREFDAKLLLSAIACTKNIDVYLGNITGLKTNMLPSYSIFHHKDSAPSPLNLSLFTKLKNKNIFISSQDEEGGVEEKKIFFSKPPKGLFHYRYGAKTLNLIDAVFTWSNFDYLHLIKRFKKFKTKIFRTGNPRADIWSNKFKNFYSGENKTKYILINSFTGGITRNRDFNEIINTSNNAFFLKNQRMYELYKKGWFDEYCIKTKFFYNLTQIIINLSKKFPQEKILIRPHPNENLQKWQFMFKGIKNIIVTKENTSTYWMHRAKVVIQNGCYTSIEAANLGVDILTYVPNEIKKHVKSFTASLGKRCNSEKDLSNNLKAILRKKKIGHFKKIRDKNFKLVNSRFDFPKETFNSEKIVGIWKNILKRKRFKKNIYDEILFKIYIFLKNTKYRFLKNFKKENKIYENRKFDDLNLYEVSRKINLINYILKPKKRIKFKIINSHLVKIFT